MGVIATNQGMIFFSGSIPQFGSDGDITSSMVTGKWEIDPDDGQSIQFRIPKEKLGTTHDKIGLYVSASGKIGIGTKDPESSFDVRDTSEDVDPTNKRTGTKILNIDKDEQKFDVPISASFITASSILATNFIGTTFNGALVGNATTATTLETARNIGGVSFNGSGNIDLPGVNSGGTQDTTGTAATASFVTGSAVAGNISGNAATATTLATARSIGGVSFDGSRDINLPGVNTAGNQDTTGNAETAGKITVTADELSANHPLIFIDDTTPDGEAEALKASRVVTVNPNTGELVLGGLSITFTQGDGRSTFGTVTFTANDAGGTRRTATINLT